MIYEDGEINLPPPYPWPKSRDGRFYIGVGMESGPEWMPEYSPGWSKPVVIEKVTAGKKVYESGWMDGDEEGGIIAPLGIEFKHLLRAQDAAIDALRCLADSQSRKESNNRVYDYNLKRWRVSQVDK